MAHKHIEELADQRRKAQQKLTETNKKLVLAVSFADAKHANRTERQERRAQEQVTEARKAVNKAKEEVKKAEEKLSAALKDLDKGKHRK